MKQKLEWIKRTIENQRLSHLYLICGSTPQEKKEMALKMAYEIFKHQNDTPYLEQLVNSLSYGNLFYIKKEGNSIKKEQILSLQEEFSKTSLIAGPRVYIIENIETLTTSAANSLLKFMEEPSGKKTIGILLTEDKDQILPTIISRSQVFFLKEQTEEDVFKNLIENQLEEIDANLLALISKDMNEIFSLLEDENYLSLKETFIKLTHSLDNKETPLRLLVPTPSFLWGDKKWFELFLEILIKYFLDIIHMHMNEPIYFKNKENILRNTRILNVKQCEKIIEDIQDIIKKQRYYINIDLSFVTLLTIIEKRRVA